MSEKEIIRFEEEDCRPVTEDNPLIINASPASYACLDIQGGFIQSTVDARVKIENLTKTS